MSRTQRRTGGSSPIKKHIRYSGATGLFSYYDKGTEENVELESLEVVILDVKDSISGYMESKGASISSNLVSNLATEPFKVVAFVDKKPLDIAKGLYKDIKDKVTAKEVGGRFTANVFGLADVGDGQEMVSIQLSGVALGSWIEFTKQYPNDTFYDYKITLTKGALSKRVAGNTVGVTAKEEADLEAKIKKNSKTPRPVWFYVVSVTPESLTDEESEVADEASVVLGSYFGAMKSAPESASTEKVTKAKDPKSAKEDAGSEEDDDDLPF